MAQTPRRWVWLKVFIVLIAVNLPIVIHVLKKEPPPLPPVTTKPAVAPLEARTQLVDTLAQETMLVSRSMSMDGEWFPYWRRAAAARLAPLERSIAEGRRGI